MAVSANFTHPMENEKKVCLVTGANDGIGFYTAKALAEKNFKVILWCRSDAKSQETAERILSLQPDADLITASGDLESFDLIEKGVKEVFEEIEKLDVLIHNAGIFKSERQYNDKNIEKVFAVNHLAPFYMTHLFIPLLEKSPESRVIVVSSDAHHRTSIHFEDLYGEKKYNGLKAYAQSKLANVMFTYEFQRKKPDDNISIFAVQPGLVKTNIGIKGNSLFTRVAWKSRTAIWKSKTPEQGAQTSIYLATEPIENLESGKYYDNCAPKETSNYSHNKSDAAKLWRISESLCRISDYF